MQKKIKELNNEVKNSINVMRNADKKAHEINSIVEMMKAGIGERSIDAIPFMCDIILEKLDKIMYEDIFGLYDKLGKIRDELEVIEIVTQDEEGNNTLNVGKHSN